MSKWNMTLRRNGTVFILALLLSSCGGLDRVSVDKLPVPAGAEPGGCSAPTLEAIKQRDLDAVRKLRARRAVGNCEETQAAVFAAINHYDVERLRLLLAAGVDRQATRADLSCWPPLAYAFRKRHDGENGDAIVTDTAMLKLLIDAGADIELEWRPAG